MSPHRRATVAFVERVLPADPGVGLDLGNGRGTPVPARGCWRTLDLVGTPAVVGDALALPFGAASFDTVVARDVFYVLPYPLGALQELARVLRRGGRLILTSPLLYPPTTEPGDRWRFTPLAWRELLGSAGFRDVRTEPLGGSLGEHLGQLAAWAGYPRVARVLSGFRPLTAAPALGSSLGITAIAGAVA